MTRAPQNLVQKYFQWFCSFPVSSSPGFNNNGDRTIELNKNNNHEYIFLNPAFGGENNRDIGTIERGKRLFIPTCSFVASEFEAPGASINRLYEYADVDYGNIEYSHVQIDGEPLQDLEQFRVRTEPFEVTFPDDALFGVPKGNCKAIADGRYMIWEPSTTAGKHTIHYEGKINLADNPKSLDRKDHYENVTYTFNIS